MKYSSLDWKDSVDYTLNVVGPSTYAMVCMNMESVTRLATDDYPGIDMVVDTLTTHLYHCSLFNYLSGTPFK